MPRVAGVDPGTVSFDLCVLQDGEPVLEQVFETGSLSEDSGPLLNALASHGPYDLVYGPSGYGLPLVVAADVGERELAEMVLVRPDEESVDTGVGGMRSLLRALARSGLPVVFGPGVIHLPSVPSHRKYNRIDLGTADKVCAAAYAIVDQAARRAIAPRETALVLLKAFGGAFSAALAIADGQIVDGMGGSSGPLGVRAAGALDGELAYLLAPRLRKRTLFTGGALDPTGAGGAHGPFGAVVLPRACRGLDGAARGRCQGGAGADCQHDDTARDRRVRSPCSPAGVGRGAGHVAFRHRPGARARARSSERGSVRCRVTCGWLGGRFAR